VLLISTFLLIIRNEEFIDALKLRITTEQRSYVTWAIYFRNIVRVNPMKRRYNKRPDLVT